MENWRRIERWERKWKGKKRNKEGEERRVRRRRKEKFGGKDLESKASTVSCTIPFLDVEVVVSWVLSDSRQFQWRHSLVVGLLAGKGGTCILTLVDLWAESIQECYAPGMAEFFCPMNDVSRQLENAIRRLSWKQENWECSQCKFSGRSREFTSQSKKRTNNCVVFAEDITLMPMSANLLCKAPAACKRPVGQVIEGEKFWNTWIMKNENWKTFPTTNGMTGNESRF